MMADASSLSDGRSHWKSSVAANAPASWAVDEPGNVCGSNTCKSVAGGSGESDRWIGEGRRCGEPIGGGDIRAHREGNSGGTVPDASPDDREKAEGSDELAKELGGAGADVRRRKEEGKAEHQMSRCNPGERPGNLCRDVGRVPRAMRYRLAMRRQASPRD